MAKPAPFPVYIVLRRLVAGPFPSGWKQATPINFVSRQAAERWIAKVQRPGIEFRAEEVREFP